jgi:hemin uptake protein HemP
MMQPARAMNTSRDKKNLSGAGEPKSTTGRVRQIELADNRIESRDLFIDGREIVIAHGEETYRLRLTAQNKLILTK